jgi:hydrogenase-4 component B
MTSALLGTAALALVLACVLGARPRLWLALNSHGALSGLGAAASVLSGGRGWALRSALTLGGENVFLTLDALSALFLVLVSLVGGLGALYASEYWADDHFPRSAPRGRSWWSALVLSMGLVLTCANGLHFLFAWEAFALSAYFLITLDRERSEVRRAGWLYLAASHAGTMALFAFFSALAAGVGTWDLGPLRDRPDLAPLFWLALLGFGVKAGMFPLHIWLPSAHAGAPSHVSAIMSAVAVKMGVYGIVRFSGWLPLPDGAGWTVLGIGCASASWASSSPWPKTTSSACWPTAPWKTSASSSLDWGSPCWPRQTATRPGGRSPWPDPCCTSSTTASSSPCSSSAQARSCTPRAPGT